VALEVAEQDVAANRLYALPVMTPAGGRQAGERILTPLLDNAGRYASHDILVACVSAPGGTQVHVSDDGPGVPADLGPAVFDPGRRADPADGHDGAGLGLALAHRLARNAGGDITLAETPGPTGGAHFVITLPGVRSGDGSGRRGC
jgi:signal transduction histidine kinase